MYLLEKEDEGKEDFLMEKEEIKWRRRRTQKWQRQQNEVQR